MGPLVLLLVTQSGRQVLHEAQVLALKTALPSSDKARAPPKPGTEERILQHKRKYWFQYTAPSHGLFCFINYILSHICDTLHNICSLDVRSLISFVSSL